MYHCQEVEFYNQCVNMRKVATGLRNIFIASLTFVMVCGTASAGDYALPFVRIVRDPVSASMGFAGVASGSETAYSSFRNSSVIPLSGDRFSTGFSYQNWAPDGVKTSNMNFGAAFKAGRFGFAVGGAYQMGEEYTTADRLSKIRSPTPPFTIMSFGENVPFGLPDASAVVYSSPIW